MLKIFGERNTGTNYLTNLINKNLSINLLRGTAYRLFGFNKSELYKNLFFYYSEKYNLGWKHSNIFNENVISNLKRNPEISVVVLVKNPYSFLTSLHKRPYHNMKLKNLNLLNFLNSKWVCVKREKTYSYFDNPVNLWNNKVESYFKLKYEFPERVLIIKFEELVKNPADIIGFIGKLKNIKFNKKNFLNISKSTKNEKKSFEYYKDYYLNEKWSVGLNKSHYSLINKYLNLDLMNLLDYKLRN